MSSIAPPKAARFGAAILVAVLLAALGAVTVERKVASFQTPGFTAERQGGAWAVTGVATEATGLRPGDLLVLVDGDLPASAAALRDRLLTAPTSRLAVLRGDRLLEVDYVRPGLEIDVPYLLLASTGLAYLAIGLWGLLRSRRRPAGLFYAWCLASAAVYLLAWVPSGSVDLVAKTSFWTEELGRLLLPPLTLHFFLVFPAPLFPRRGRALVPFLYLPAAALGALQADLVLNRGRLLFGGLSRRAIEGLDRLELAHLVGLAVLAIGALAWQIAQRDDWRERRQLQWIAAGLVVGYLPFLALYVVPWSLGLSAPEWLTVAAVLPLAAVPVSIVYAILRYRLWDVEILLRNAVSYTVTLLVGAGLFSALQLAIGRGLGDADRTARGALTLLAGIVVAGVLVPAQRGVRIGFERLRYGDALRRRRALTVLGRELLEERRLPELCRRLLESLREGLELRRVNLYLMGSEGLGLLMPDANLPRRWPADEPSLWHAGCHLLEGSDLPGAAASFVGRLHAAGYRYAMPLELRGRPVALLVASFRVDGAPLNSEELDTVRSLLDQAALAIENAQLLEALQVRLDEVNRLRERSERILESSPAGIAVVDEQATVVAANRAFAELLGETTDGLVGRSLAELLPVALPPVGAGLVDVSYCDPAGRERYLQMSLADAAESHFDAGRRVLVVHDVTERVEMESTLREKERLAALGMLAAGVAHEVNTPITGISSYAQLLLAETRDDDPRYELLKKVETQTFRASRIVNNLLELARNRGAEHHPVDLAGVVRETLAAVEAKVRQSGASVTVEAPPGALRVLGDESELQQVAANLVSNALDAAAPGAGRVTIRLEARGERTLLIVEDDGPGIPAELQDKILRPFFTTKLGSGGTGLGLSITHQIVRRHDGALRFENRPDGGARFVVDLPTCRVAEAAS